MHDNTECTVDELTVNSCPSELALVQSVEPNIQQPIVLEIIIENPTPREAQMFAEPKQITGPTPAFVADCIICKETERRKIAEEKQIEDAYMTEYVQVDKKKKTKKLLKTSKKSFANSHHETLKSLTLEDLQEIIKPLDSRKFDKPPRVLHQLPRSVSPTRNERLKGIKVRDDEDIQYIYSKKTPKSKSLQHKGQKFRMVVEATQKIECPFFSSKETCEWLTFVFEHFATISSVNDFIHLFCSQCALQSWMIGDKKISCNKEKFVLIEGTETPKNIKKYKRQLKTNNDLISDELHVFIAFGLPDLWSRALINELQRTNSVLKIVIVKIENDTDDTERLFGMLQSSSVRFILWESPSGKIHRMKKHGRFSNSKFIDEYLW